MLKRTLTADEFYDWEYWLDSKERADHPSPVQWQTAAVSYQVYQLMVLVATAFGDKSATPAAKVADFLLTIIKKDETTAAKKPTREEADAAALAAFADWIALAQTPAPTP